MTTPSRVLLRAYGGRHHATFVECSDARPGQMWTIDKAPGYRVRYVFDALFGVGLALVHQDFIGVVCA